MKFGEENMSIIDIELSSEELSITTIKLCFMMKEGGLN